MKQYVEAIEKAQMRKRVPTFRAGDTIVVNVKVKEGNRERIQAFEGIVIARRNRGLNSAFTVRKMSHGEGVERVFQLHSPLIDSITVKRHGDVRKAKLYYLRELTGKAARIRESLSRGDKDAVDFNAAAEEVASAAQLSEDAAQEAAAEAEQAAQIEAEKQEKAETKADEKVEAKAEEKPAEQPAEPKADAEKPKADNKDDKAE